jgi:hypothetical protein
LALPTHSIRGDRAANLEKVTSTCRLGRPTGSGV